MTNSMTGRRVRGKVIKRWAAGVIFLLSPLMLALPTHAETWRIGVYSGQWADTRLPYLPYNAATGRLRFKDSYLYSLIVSRQLLNADIFFPGTTIGFRDARLELEGTVNLHSGLQSHSEATLGLMLRSRDSDIGSSGSINFGWANGFSYALDAPNYEYGRTLVRGHDTVQLQYYMGFEAEYAHATWERLSVFTRLHHRSGMYGVISPSKTGSNIIGVGVRMHFGQN
jgi:hypothetical protein